MNSSAPFNEELGHLDRYVGAVTRNAPTDSESGRAQQRLLRRLHDHGKQAALPASAVRWRWAAAAAVLAVVATTLVPFMPGSRDGVAFADVQRRFETFETMHVSLATRVGGRTTMQTRIVMDDEGRTRLDAGDLFSYVIDPGAGVMLQLFHPSRTAMRVSLGNGGTVPDAARLGWLDDIRSFQGRAERLSEHRRIDGREVTGFRLEAGSTGMVLWATREGEPVRLELQGGNGDRPMTETRIDLRFDRPVEPGSFDLALPSGYELMEK